MFGAGRHLVHTVASLSFRVAHIAKQRWGHECGSSMGIVKDSIRFVGQTQKLLQMLERCRLCPLVPDYQCQETIKQCLV